MVSHRALKLDTEACPGIAGRIPPFRELVERCIVRRHLDLDRDELVAALSVLGGEAAALEAKRLARAGALGDGEHYRPLRRRDFDLRPQHRFLESHRKRQSDVGAVSGEEAVRRNLDRYDRVAAPSGTFLPLACEADFGPVLEPLGEFEVDCLAVGQRDPLWLQRNRVVEGDLEPVGDVRAFLRRRALAEPAERPAASRTAARRAAEQPFEQVAEVGGVGAAEIEILETLSARSGAGARSGARRIAAEAASER